MGWEATYQGRLDGASYVGPAWGHFAPTSVTIIHRTPTVINNYTFVDVHKGATVYRPATPPQHNDDNWYCKKHPDSDKCKGGTIGTGGGTGGTGGGGDNGKHNEADEAPKKAADEAAQRANEAGTVQEAVNAAAKKARDEADRAAGRDKNEGIPRHRGRLPLGLARRALISGP